MSLSNYQNLVIKGTQQDIAQKDAEINYMPNSPWMHLVLFSRSERAGKDLPSPVKLTDMTENIKVNRDLWINRYTPPPWANASYCASSAVSNTELSKILRFKQRNHSSHKRGNLKRHLITAAIKTVVR